MMHKLEGMPQTTIGLHHMPYTFFIKKLMHNILF